MWQVNFTLPGGIEADCFATASVSAAGQTGNTVTLPIAAAGEASCTGASMPASLLSKLDSGGNVTVAAFALGKIDNGAGTTQETASGSKLRYLTSEWITLNSCPRFGLCRVYDRIASVASGDGAERLRHLAVPTLVIHGLAGRLCDVSGGRATAEAIPGAQLVLMEAMGHDLPPGLRAELAGRIAEFVWDVERL